MSRIPTPTFRRGQALSARELNGLSHAVPELRGDSRTIVNRTGSRLAVSAASAPYPMFPVFMARVLSATPYAANMWTYQVEQVFKGDDGYATLEQTPNGYTGVAYNMLELGNRSTGIQGNGVNVDQLPSGFQIGPIPSGMWPHPVYLWPVARESGPFELWLYYPNPVVGECP